MNNFAPIDINITRGIINGQTYVMIPYEEYVNNEALRFSDTAVVEEVDGKQIILPYRGEYGGKMTNPGIYNAGCVDFCVYPTEENINDFIPSKVISVNSKMSMKEMLENEETLARLDEPWITSPDNITHFTIQEEDQAEMICLKTALNEKKMDFDKYSARFGDNFPNDKRQMKNNSVTLNIIKRFCEKCDMEAMLTLRDKNENVPNPIGREITVSLTEICSSEEAED